MAIATESPTPAVTLQWPLSDEQFVKLCALNSEMRPNFLSVLIRQVHLSQLTHRLLGA